MKEAQARECQRLMDVCPDCEKGIMKMKRDLFDNKICFLRCHRCGFEYDE